MESADTLGTSRFLRPDCGGVMAYEILFTHTAAGHVRAYRTFEQRIILDALEEQLRHEPTTETRNRKRLGENELSDWELRVQKFRVFYDVIAEDDRRVVKIKGVGHKQHDKLYVGGQEVQL
jgi:mRNA-degrading endonuclease RelE of RelBE toxin-antitoxin system